MAFALLASPLWAEEVHLDTASGRLHGTLDLPASPAPHPCVLAISGSGPTDRDGNQAGMRNDSLKQLGAGLAKRGLCVLRYDKRGVGASAGALRSEQELRFEDYAEGAAAWLAWLRREPRVARLAVLGHGEGALLAVLAARRAKVDAVVSIAGMGRRASELLRWQGQRLPPAQRKKSDEILRALAAGSTVAEVPAELLALYRPSVQPYLISWFKHDPAADLAELSVPVLVVHGATDLQVPAADARQLARANPRAKLVVIPEMNHVLKRAVTPEEQNRACTDPAMPVDPRVVEAIAAFLNP